MRRIRRGIGIQAVEPPTTEPHENHETTKSQMSCLFRLERSAQKASDCFRLSTDVVQLCAKALSHRVLLWYAEFI